MSDAGPFTDDMVRGMLQARKMQHEMIEHIENAAKILAAAGIASNAVLGDCPEYAIKKWCEVIEKRAIELMREKRHKTPMQEKLEGLKQKMIEQK